MSKPPRFTNAYKEIEGDTFIFFFNILYFGAQAFTFRRIDCLKKLRKSLIGKVVWTYLNLYMQLHEKMMYYFF